MIIQNVRAQNVLKYSHLVLNDIPDKGLIAISGRNESGKTAVVETICFALFGRTFSVPEDRLEKIIRWNENSCQVELQFQSNDDQVYRIERSLDYKGTHAAQMFRDGEEEPFVTGPHSVEESVYEICGFDFQQYLDALYLAQREISTPHSQTDTIKAIAGATDLEDILSELERDVTAEHDRIADIGVEVEDLLKRIDKLDISEQTLDDIEQERRACNDRIRETEAAANLLDKAADEIQAGCPKVQQVGKALATTSLDTSLNRWGEMIDALDSQMQVMRDSCNQIDTDSDLCTEHNDLNLYIKELGDRLDAFEDVQDRMDSYRIQLATLLGENSANNSELNSEKPLPQQHRDISREVATLRFKNVGAQLFIFSGVVLALFNLLGWWQLSYSADSHTAEWFTELLSDLFGSWSDKRNHLLQMAAIGFGAFSAIMIFISMGISRRIRQLKKHESKVLDRLDDIRARAKLIDEADELPFTTLVEGLEKLNNEGISQLLKTYTQGMGQPFVNQLSLATEQDKLLDMLNACMNSVGDLRESIATEIGRHQRIIEESHERIDELNQQKDDIHQREKEIQELRDQVDVLGTQAVRHEEHIKTLKLSQYLLHETCRNIYSRFNQVLSKYTGKVMPKLTDNRYKQMQIGEDLGVRVFSQEKNDFGELEEFSSGTQRQMLLAVRLAMSKALIEAVEQNKQFIILDEPFAFFDRERIRASLAALPKVDKHLDQIWIITQEFEDLSPFALHIECSRENEEMIVGQYSG